MVLCSRQIICLNVSLCCRCVSFLWFQLGLWTEQWDLLCKPPLSIYFYVLCLCLSANQGVKYFKYNAKYFQISYCLNSYSNMIWHLVSYSHLMQADVLNVFQVS